MATENNIDYDGKSFIPKLNSVNGEVSEQTVFHYHQKDTVIWAEYAGGDIMKGFLIGTVDEAGMLDFTYQHLNIKKEIKIGKCHSIPVVLKDNCIELHEQWQWLNGDHSKGTSILIEIWITGRKGEGEL